jgi:hypothetical protein
MVGGTGFVLTCTHNYRYGLPFSTAKGTPMGDAKWMEDESSNFARVNPTNYIDT